MSAVVFTKNYPDSDETKSEQIRAGIDQSFDRAH